MGQFYTELRFCFTHGLVRNSYDGSFSGFVEVGRGERGDSPSTNVVAREELDAGDMGDIGMTITGGIA